MSDEILVLNNSYMPIAKTNPERAAILILLDKAFSIKDSDKILRSQFLSLPIPKIIVLKEISYIRKHGIGYCKKAVMDRDKKCLMCSEEDKSKLTLEHIIPKSRWNKISKERKLTYSCLSFDNTCILCKKCNQWKGDRLPEEIGWEVSVTTPLSGFDINWDELFELGAKDDKTGN